ncbi:MAG: hypothetical protein I3J02_09340 [Prevotella sp.]|nr:hypothetical protein [Prevotella sp.]
MDKIVAIVRLMAKTGLFFANADGNYAASENRYLDKFIANIEGVGDLEDELREEIKQSLNQKFTLDEVVDDTRELLNGFSATEQKAILHALHSFISDVIRADEKLHPLEKENFKAWEKAFEMN